MLPFDGLGMPQIVVIRDRDQADQALAEMLKAGTVGFDTESKPTFRKGEISKGPHVIQFATLEKAYIFRPHDEDSQHTIRTALLSAELIKVGFGLKGDLSQIRNRIGVQPSSIIDLDHSFSKLGYRKFIGTKSAIALLFQRRLAKSKSVTISDWGAKELSEKQLIYAANDAYAAIRIHHALQQSNNAFGTG